MTEKLIPTTAMLTQAEVNQVEEIAKQENRSKSSLLRVAFLEYAKRLNIDKTNSK